MPMYKDISEKLSASLRGFLRRSQLDTDRSFSLDINSAGDVRVTGITEIKGYDEWSVIAVTRVNITEIKGSELHIQRFSDSEIYVSGEINSISFIKR